MAVSPPAAVRREQILAIIREQGYARVTQLSQQFGISEVTVRTDLDTLAASSPVQRVHGGAMADGAIAGGPMPSGPIQAGAMAERRASQDHADTQEQAFEKSLLAARDEKQRIGMAAAELVESGQAIVLDVGTTTTAIATALLARTDLHDVVVITNALNIALALESAIPRFTVIVTGGTLRPLQHSLVDPLAGAVLEHVRADIAFIGCSGVDARAGVTNVNLPEADAKRRMIATAARTVVVADSSKLGVSHLSRVAQLSEISTLITGAEAPQEQVAALAAAGVTVLRSKAEMQ